MIPETDPVRKHCSHCGTGMTHVRYFWRKIENKMQCPGCRSNDARWK